MQIFDDERLQPRRNKPPRRPYASFGQNVGEHAVSEPPVGPRKRVWPLRNDRTTTTTRRKRRRAARPTLREALDKSESEAHFQARVVKLAKLCGFKYVYHTWDSRRSTSGFPDLVLVHPDKRRLIFAELKTERGTVTLAQTLWKVALERVAGIGYCLWRPSDWDAIVRELQR